MEGVSLVPMLENNNKKTKQKKKKTTNKNTHTHTKHDEKGHFFQVEQCVALSSFTVRKWYFIGKCVDFHISDKKELETIAEQ